MLCRCALIASAFFLLPCVARSEGDLVVHEWGTFTALQDENGQAIGGINTDDEPVPGFVHNIAPHLLVPTASDSKSVARCHAGVTMRLETPVIYFYPGEDFHSKLDVHVSFPSGWLTQFYPKAQAEAPGLGDDGTGPLVPFTIGRLRWKDLSLSWSNEGPATNSPVWIRPRQVDSATVEVNGEHEKYLFYRGVGHVDAPVRVVRSGPEFVMTRTDRTAKADEIHQLWLADIRADGTAAVRVVRPFTEETAFLVKTPTAFALEDYSVEAKKTLESNLRTALIEAGLFEKEAAALLGTWQASYFNSPGLRLFFVVPAKWTESALHLTIQVQNSAGKKELIDAAPTRVMVGRIELVTPEQRALLANIATLLESNDADGLRHVENGPTDAQWNKATASYLALGRFRNALLLDEQKRHPRPGLATFIKTKRLEGYTPPPLFSLRQH